MSEEKSIDILRRWLSEGYREIKSVSGKVDKVELTDHERNLFSKLIFNHENPPKRLSRADMVKQADEDCQQLLQKATSVEAMAWLQELPEEALVISGGSGESGGLYQDEALVLVQSLYKLGAVKVTALDIATNRSLPEHQDTDTLIIELPEDTKIRKQLFKKANQLARKYNWDLQEDEGQKYLGIRWD